MGRKFFCVLLTLFLLIPFPSTGKVLDRVVAVVDGELITLSDLDEAMARYGKATVRSVKNPLEREIRLSQDRKEVLERLVEDKLLQKVAIRFGIKVKDEEVERTIERIKQKGRITDAQMERELVSQGFTLDGYRLFLKAQIRRARIIERLIKPKVSMDEKRILEYYHNHRRRYQGPARVRVSHILIKVAPDATPEQLEMAKEKMNKVLQRLREGAEFEEVAILYSEHLSARSGGDLGFFKKGEIIPAFEEVVFEMEVGEVSGVIRSSHGLHLLKVTERKVGAAKPYEQIREQVMEDYYRAEVERVYVKWLEDVKDRSNVEVKL